MPSCATRLPITVDNREVLCQNFPSSTASWSIVFFLHTVHFWDALSSLSQQKTMYIHRISWWHWPISHLCNLCLTCLGKIAKLMFTCTTDHIITVKVIWVNPVKFRCERAIGWCLSGSLLHIKIGKVVSFSLPTGQRILHYSRRDQRGLGPQRLLLAMMLSGVQSV